MKRRSTRKFVFASRRFQPGEGPRGLLCNCEIFEPSFQALIWRPRTKYVGCLLCVMMSLCFVPGKCAICKSALPHTIVLCRCVYTYYIHSQAKHTDLGPGPGIPSRQVFELCCCEIIDLLFSKEQQWMDAGLAIFHTYLCLMVPSVFILYKFYKIEKNYVRVSGKVY